MIITSYKLTIFIIIVSFASTACVTNTILDVLIFSNAPYSLLVNDNQEGEMMCVELEAIGYQFEDFSVNEVGLQVTYSDSRQQQYPQGNIVTPIIVTNIERDYNNVDIFSSDESLRLENNARTFCEDYQQIASEQGISLHLQGILYWDYVDGVRGGFFFNEVCEIVNSYGWSTGSYARSYESNPNAVCPSGHVVQ